MMIGHDTLVLVADGSRLLLFRNEGDETFPVLETLAHEAATRAATHEQGADAPGRTHASVGAHRSSYGETDWHQQSEDRFARRAAELLEQAASNHTDAPIVVAAAPRTLGELRKHYGPETTRRLQAEIDKDLAHLTTDGIVEAILARAEA